MERRKKLFSKIMPVMMVVLVMSALSSCSRTKKDVPQEFIDAFETADTLIAAAAVIEENDGFWNYDVMNALETLMLQVSIYQGKQTSTTDKAGLRRIYNDLGILFADMQNMGDNPDTNQLRAFNRDWMKLRDRFEPYIPAARKAPPVYTPPE